jgi:hypothetical protein
MSPPSSGSENKPSKKPARKQAASRLTEKCYRSKGKRDLKKLANKTEAAVVCNVATVHDEPIP